MDWSKIKWLCDGSDNNLIRMFLADIDNIGNCDCCPYKTAHPTNGKLRADNLIVGSRYLATIKSKRI